MLYGRQMTRFTHGAANPEADGIQRLPHRWQRVVTVAGDYIEEPKETYRQTDRQEFC